MFDYHETISKTRNGRIFVMQILIKVDQYFEKYTETPGKRLLLEFL